MAYVIDGCAFCTVDRPFAEVLDDQFVSESLSGCRGDPRAWKVLGTASVKARRGMLNLATKMEHACRELSSRQESSEISSSVISARR